MAVSEPPPFRFEYRPGTIRFGTGAVASLGEELADAGLEAALVVTGRTVGDTASVMDPVRAGLGDRLAGVVAETTPEKSLRSAGAVAAAMAETTADVLVAVGGGSSLDVATVASVVAAAERSVDELAAELAERGTVAMPDGPLTPVVAVPTTLAGADLSQVAGITAGPDEGLATPASGGLSDERLFPTAVVADPELVATTPRSVLAPSAMNGFDKGVESLYARTATPITDATAIRGLALLRESLPALGDETSQRQIERAVLGTLLVQYGISRPDGTTLSLIHAFGHGLRTVGGLHQGRAHGAVAPAVLRYLFDHVDGRRHHLAAALGADGDLDDAAAADAAIAGVRTVRDGLGLPAGLRETDLDRERFPAVAAAILDDPLLRNVPAGLDPTQAAIEAVLETAW